MLDLINICHMCARLARRRSTVSSSAGYERDQSVLDQISWISTRDISDKGPNSLILGRYISHYTGPDNRACPIDNIIVKFPTLIRIHYAY